MILSALTKNIFNLHHEFKIEPLLTHFRLRYRYVVLRHLCNWLLSPCKEKALKGILISVKLLLQ